MGQKNGSRKTAIADRAPATKGDLRRGLQKLEQRMEQRFAQIDGKFTQIDNRFTQIDSRFDELKRHFEVVAENIEDSFRGAFSDELSLLHDKSKEHDARITILEQKAGMR